MDPLSALRIWCQEQNIEALIVPKHDSFSSEYVHPHDDVLAYMSGFTGSLGYALITLKNAYLFVDGRYPLQAKQETDPAFWSVEALSLSRIQALIQKNDLKRIGFYDQTIMIDFERSLHRDNPSVEWIAFEEDPFETLWTDRPLKTYTQAYIHKKAGESFQEKLARVQRTLSAPYLLHRPDAVCWLFNLRGNDVLYTPLVHGVAILFPQEKPILFLEPEHIHDEISAYLGDDVRLMDKNTLRDSVYALAPLCADESVTPVAYKAALNKHIACPVTALKACKSVVEQHNIIDIHTFDGACVTRCLNWLKHHPQKSSLTELDIVDFLYEERAKHPLFRGESFPTIAGSGPHGAIIHYRPQPSTNRPLTDCLVLIDSGGQYTTGTTDITRTLALYPPTEFEKKAYTLVLKGLIALSTAVFKKGTTGAHLDILARQFLWMDGLDYAHGTGHGVGYFLNVHEGPHAISQRSMVPLEQGMVLSNEPGYYKENDFGIRLENLMMVIKHDHPDFYCFQTLTRVPFDHDLIDWARLTPREKTWVESFDV